MMEGGLRPPFLSRSKNWVAQPTLQIFTTAVKKELDAAYKPIALSKHKAKMPIIRCKTAIRTALGKKTTKEADEKLDNVEKKLSAAKKALGI